MPCCFSVLNVDDDHSVALDVATLFRVLPWVFLMRDSRDPQTLVKMALADTCRFLDRSISADARRAIMRGLALNWFKVMGVDPDPRHIEMVVGLVQQAVDGLEAAAPLLEGELDDAGAIDGGT